MPSAKGAHWQSKNAHRTVGRCLGGLGSLQCLTPDECRKHFKYLLPTSHFHPFPPTLAEYLLSLKAQFEVLSEEKEQLIVAKEKDNAVPPSCQNAQWFLDL